MSFQKTYILTPPAPYRFEYFRKRVESSSNTYLYSIGDNRLSRAHIIGGRPVLVHVSAVETTAAQEAPRITLDVHGAQDEAQADAAADIWRHMLSVDRPLLPFYEKVADDPVMQNLTAELSGLHLLLDSGPFESMILSIIGQQVNLTFAENLKRGLVELCASSIDVADSTHFAFPSPEQIARLEYDQLRPLKFSQRKAEYVIDFSRGVADGRIDLAALETMSNEEAIDSLVKLRGIGRWTAECVLLFGLGRPDLLPAADIGLRNAIQHFWGWDHQPTELEVRAFAQGWQGYESYATYYLWTALGLARAAQKQQKETTPTGRRKNSKIMAEQDKE
ncbi:DNA-3-methyladenine glycosylase II [Tumebacillus sp. BK434]|uniref:DNA-3-methyladenine glycosylase family protein n=1 Tax=Tumebacillus sp. BK434 TaxID=2512169 RepID=UPI001042F474|nr:DNA-3-methyladenine glycosylase [Tumebacillus sp. BK434]TCP59487.1 DNA-3-methyladenine glycosylase II [Tumebacillus sp. BK434]